MRPLTLQNWIVQKSIPLGAFASVLVFVSSCEQAEKNPPVTASPPEPDAFCGRPVDSFETARKLILERRDNFPKVGEQAHPFRLPSATSSEEIALSDLHREKPVVLILGSGSCSILGRSDAWMLRFHEQFHDHFNFAFLYIRESHPSQGYRPAKYAEEIPPVFDAESLQERIKTAAAYARAKSLPFPVLVDTMNDETARLYSAWPVRLFVIDRDGSVLYSGGQAPWFYNPFRGYQHKTPVSPDLQALPQSDQSLQEFLESQIRQ